MTSCAYWVHPGCTAYQLIFLNHYRICTDFQHEANASHLLVEMVEHVMMLEDRSNVSVKLDTKDCTVKVCFFPEIAYLFMSLLNHLKIFWYTFFVHFKTGTFRVGS